MQNLKASLPLLLQEVSRLRHLQKANASCSAINRKELDAYIESKKIQLELEKKVDNLLVQLQEISTVKLWD